MALPSNNAYTHAQVKVASFVDEFNTAYNTWMNAVQSQSLQSPAAQAATEDVLHRWRTFNGELKAQSDTVLNNEPSMTELTNLISQVTEERQVLAKLQREAITRTDQADSLNPRIRDSPYTNILGIRRIFSSGTWSALLATSILFGILTLVLIGLLVWAIIAHGSIVNPSFPQAAQSGGWSKSGSGSGRKGLRIQ